MKYYSAIGKNEIMPFASIDGPRYYHTKWSKSDTERHILYDMAHMWNIRYKWTYI